MLATLETLTLVVEKTMLHRLLNIVDNTSHSLHELLVRQQSSFIFRIHCDRECYRKSIISAAIALCDDFCVAREDFSDSEALCSASHHAIFHRTNYLLLSL